jgi:predicted RNase H-like nuclease (RuvC/YqgF family)
MRSTVGVSTALSGGTPKAEAEPSALGHLPETQTSPQVVTTEVSVLSQELKRTKRALESKKAQLRTAREELAVAKEEAGERQSEIEGLTAQLESANAAQEQYRNWWINEVQFTKLILSKVPNANQDWDLIRTSQSHYLGRY